MADEEEKNEEQNAEATEAVDAEVSEVEVFDAPKNRLIAFLLYFFKVFFIVTLIYVIIFTAFRVFQGVGEGSPTGVLLGLFRGIAEGMGCGYIVACFTGIIMTPGTTGYKKWPVENGRYKVKWYNIILGILGLVWFSFLTWIMFFFG